MKEKINCPICGKRAFDICSSVRGEVWIELKCPHCRNIVQISHRVIVSHDKYQRKNNILTEIY